MKKILLLLILALFSVNSHSQTAKKKPIKASSVKKTALATADKVTAELFEKKDAYQFYLLAGKDTLVIKKISGQIGTKAPTDCKITPFTAKGTKLYSVTWLEKSIVGDPKKKLENITETHTEIWDIPGKAKVLDNVGTVNNISEIVFLDPNNTASKTVEKIRRDGFECTVLPTGEVVLKNKTQEDKLAYDAVAKKFVSVKKK